MPRESGYRYLLHERNMFAIDVISNSTLLFDRSYIGMCLWFAYVEGYKVGSPIYILYYTRVLFQ